MNIQEQINILYQSALSLHNEHILIDICTIDQSLAARIKSSIGIDLTNYVVSIDNYSIKHTLQRHGNPITEAKRGQIHITPNDFLLLPQIILEFDTVTYSVKSNENKDTQRESLIFEKTIGDTYFVVKEIRTVSKKAKKNRIILQTMYKRKTLLPK